MQQGKGRLEGKYSHPILKIICEIALSDTIWAQHSIFHKNAFYVYTSKKKFKYSFKNIPKPQRAMILEGSS